MELNNIKYIIGIATTFLAVYALVNDFKVEIKDENGKVLRKKLTLSGKLNIGIPIIFLISIIVTPL
jgi:hypothetical protein